ncbi:LOW QUALITY PROTEIN: hypothetical protein SETIT_4G092500v2 [Setaria italica]|uniref:Uncharacterized protein n=1 Tax=Setaria italica TaxID=4555 RepID=A0A368QSC5_SETIT|nr:LOW QUALITY PROTEIN: hypothetical protein SETIT_4G092500v2 [Setaria italica]
MKAVKELSNCRLQPCSPALSGADIANIVVADPLLLRSTVKNVGPRLHALRDCLGSSAPQIARFLLVSSRFVRHRNVVPKLEFFISFYGSFERLLVIMNKNKKGNDVLFSDLERHAISAVADINKEKVAPKLKFLKSTLGCSESEVAIAVSKMPCILGYSEENLIRKIQFLIKEVGMEPQHIVERPALLGLSLEKRLVPPTLCHEDAAGKGVD